MKKILITGRNSYVGNSFEKWIEKYSDKYEIEKISVRDDAWKQRDFAMYDSVLHVAGIAHVSTDPNMEDLYYKVNRDLAIELAKKAKDDGVKQFIFMSSIIVYGDGSSKREVIDRETVPTPSNFYGRSKLQAEEGINHLADGRFKVVIVRPPMIYGKGSKGNYPKLANAAKLLPFFPLIVNERSMLHVDNLSEFIRLMVENEEEGLFYPQNKEYVQTSEMVRLIAKVHGKNIKLVRVFNPILKMMSGRIGIIDKVFGSLVYSQEISIYEKKSYYVVDLKESIKKTEV